MIPGLYSAYCEPVWSVVVLCCVISYERKILGENKSVFAINTSSKFGNAWKNRDHPFFHLHLWPGRAILAFPRYNDFKHGTHQTWDEKHMLAFDGHFVLFPLFHYETFRWAFLCKVSSGKRENGKNERMKQHFLSAKDLPQSIPGA